MMKNSISSIVKLCVLVLVVVSLCFVCSCKKAPEQAAPSQPPAEKKAPETAEEQKPAVQEQPKVEVEEPNKPAEEPVADAEQSEPAPDEKAAAGMVPIKLELPKPMFVGTPQDTRVPNLEKPSGGPRAPFLAPEGTVNLALNKPVSSSDEEPIIGELEMITDDDKEAADGSYVELGPFLQHVTVDLGQMSEIYAVIVWHYHKQARVYFDVVIQVADDPDFVTNVQPIFNNDIDNSSGLGVGKDMHYTETNEGRLFDCLSKGVKGRYVRCYSNGNTGNDLNHYIEVAVYGKPVK